MRKLLERVAVALERIAGALEKTPAPKSRARAAKQETMADAMTGDPVVAGKVSGHSLIVTYCEAYKKRYGCNPVVDGKVAGMAVRLLKAIPLERAQMLVQAYLQMDDPWFLKKAHAFDVLVQNLNVVAVSLANGTRDPHERGYWSRVFGEEVKHAPGNIPIAGSAAAGKLGSPSLPGAPGRPALESPKGRR